MSLKRKRITWSVVFAAIACVCLGWSILNAQQEQTPAVETLLPANAVIYFGMDGMDAHRETWEKTAAHQALYETGLAEALEKMIASFGSAAGPQFDSAKNAYELVAAKGLSFAAALPGDPNSPPLPYATLVLHEASNLEPALSEVMMSAFGREVQFQPKEVHGRKVTSGMISVSQGLEAEIGWWTEGKHLVVVVGFGAVDATLAVATGEKPNITTSELWKKYREKKPEFEMASLLWLDFGAVRAKFGEMPLPVPEKQVTVNQILAALGLDKLGAFACQSGYKGKAQWVETTLEAPGPRTGLLSLADEKPITFADLPPLPFGNTGFYACSVDWSKVYDTLVKVARDVSAFGPPDAAAQLEEGISTAPQALGFDPKTELLDPLGNVICVYGDNRQGIFFMGMGLAIKVDDASTLQNTANKLLNQVSVQARPDEVAVARTQKQGREIVTLQVGGGAANPSYAIDNGWLVVGLFPQVVEAFFLRVDKKLTVWEPTKLYQEAFDAVPKEFQSIAVSDPRKMYRTLVGLAPAVLPAIQVAIRNSPLGNTQGGMPMAGFSAADLPPAELVGQPLFPNVAVCTTDDAGIHWTSRSSLPAIPFLDSGGGGTVAVAAIGVALLLPAVQQAREAARRAASKNNLKQILLALHNFHEVQGHFPQGTHENKELQPDKRLSWLADILPFVDQAPLHQQLNFEKAWDDDANASAAQFDIEVFKNPGGVMDVKTEPAATTHYVGIAGLGEDGPTLPVDDKKAGMFAYDRVTKMRDIKDGTSNTLAVGEASADFGPWAAGGNATIRAFTKKPYINGPDGIGGPFGGGSQFGLADGSVRFVSENIDPTVLESLSTINGGEVIGDF